MYSLLSIFLRWSILLLSRFLTLEYFLLLIFFSINMFVYFIFYHSIAVNLEISSCILDLWKSIRKYFLPWLVCLSWLEHLSYIPKGWGFEAQWGHIPRLLVSSLTGAHMGGIRFLSHINVFLSSPSLSKINKHLKK